MPKFCYFIKFFVAIILKLVTKSSCYFVANECKTRKYFKAMSGQLRKGCGCGNTLCDFFEV